MITDGCFGLIDVAFIFFGVGNGEESLITLFFVVE